MNSVSNSFSLRRLWMLARKHYIENGRTYLFLLATMVIALVGVSLVALINKDEFGAFEFVMLLPEVIVPLLVAKLSMSGYYITKRQLTSFTLPATHSEKYLFAVLNTTIITVVSYALVELVASIVYGIIPPPDYDPVIVGTWFVGWAHFLGVALLFGTTMLFGCTISKDNPARGFAVVMVAYLVIGALPLLLTSPGSSMWLNTQPSLPMMTTLSITNLVQEGNASVIYTTSTTMGQWVQRASDIFLPVVILVAGYYKFKEHQMK